MSEFTDLFLPPILQTPGLTFIGMVRMPTGAIALRFQNTGVGFVREVHIYLVTAGIVEYAYAIADRDMTATRYYRGIHGSPEDDELIDVFTWPDS